MSLYNDVRPQTLDEFVGNEQIISVIKGFLSSDKHPHSYLFSGQSGVGKTSLARIMANMLNIREGDLIELNAASTRGIDTIREIEDAVSYKPMFSDKRMIILDEAHELTKAAQQALLKITEDVPEYQYFVFCTTEPNKLILTLRNRFQHFKLESLSEKQLKILIDQTCKKADIILISLSVGEEIVKFSNGSARTALILLEKTTGLSQEDALKVIHQSNIDESDLNVINLCRAILHSKWSEIVEIYKQQNFNDPESLRRIILGYFHSCLLGSSGLNDIIHFSNLINIFKDSIEWGGKAQLLMMIVQAKRSLNGN